MRFKFIPYAYFEIKLFFIRVSMNVGLFLANSGKDNPIRPSESSNCFGAVYATKRGVLKMWLSNSTFRSDL